MNSADTKSMNKEQLHGKLKELRGELFTLKQKMATEKVEDLSQFRKKRQDIARVLTEINARRHAQAGAKPVKAGAKK
jgi:ribosomal protein L29